MALDVIEQLVQPSYHLPMPDPSPSTLTV